MKNSKKERNDKEEIASLKDNKEALKKKKFKKIALQKINLNTKPINISTSRYEILEYSNINMGSTKKIIIKIFSFIAVILIVIAMIFALTGKFHHQSNNNEVSENINSPINKNITSNTSNTSNISNSNASNNTNTSNSSNKSNVSNTSNNSNKSNASKNANTKTFSSSSKNENVSSHSVFSSKKMSSQK